MSRAALRHTPGLLVFCLGLGVGLALLSPSAVTAQSPAVFKAETHLIDTTVSIHDADGSLIPDISKDDLTVIEDGVVQTIRFFSPADQLPLSIGLVLDESGSQEKFEKAHEKDLEAFLARILRPQDKAFAVCFGNHLRLVSDWTSDTTAITGNLRSFDKGHHDFPELGPKEDRDLGTALNDAVYFATTERMAAITQRRKVLLIFSDGEENSSEHDLIDTIEAAQDANTLVYAIRYTQLLHGHMNARDRYGMRELDHLTTQTGGKSYDAQGMKVSQAFEKSPETCGRSTASPTSPPTEVVTEPFARSSSNPSVPASSFVRARDTTPDRGLTLLPDYVVALIPVLTIVLALTVVSCVVLARIRVVALFVRERINAKRTLIRSDPCSSERAFPQLWFFTLSVE